MFSKLNGSVENIPSASDIVGPHVLHAAYQESCGASAWRRMPASFSLCLGMEQGRTILAVCVDDTSPGSGLLL